MERQPRSPSRGRHGWHTLAAGACVVVLLSLPLAVRPDAFRDGLSAFNLGDYAAAHRIWFGLSESDDARAQSALGYLYLRGLGVPRDPELAGVWYALAADQGEPGAQLFLAVMHFFGEGMPQDYALAHVWAELALGAGEVDALEWRDQAAAHLTDEQLARARRRVADWYRGRP